MEILSTSTINIDKARDTLFFAFKDDPLLLWIFGGPNNYDKNAAWAIEKWVKWCMFHGLANALPNYESVTLWKKPGYQGLYPWNFYHLGIINAPLTLGMQACKRMLYFNHFIQKERFKYVGAKHFWHCWFIGTNTDSRQKGYARKLMQHVMSSVNSLPCCLETAKKENVMIYQKLGYNLISTIQIPHSPVYLYCMVKH